jgi:hypothetical protein
LQRRLNYLFSINKVRNKWLSNISSLWIYHYPSPPLPPFFWVLFISSILVLQMVNTRNRVTANNGESNNQEANPLPPPLLTLKQVLAMQAQMLQTMQQTLVNLHAQPQAAPPPRDRCHTRFLRPKTRCSSYVCPGSSCHTYGQNVSTEYQCLY